MSKYQVDIHHNQFAYNSKTPKVNIYKSEQILLPLPKFMFSYIRDSLNFNYNYDSKNEKIKVEKVRSLANT